MLKNKIQIIVFVAFVGLIFLSCKKENINIDLTSKNWVVIKMKKQGQSSYTKAKDSYVLGFTSDTTYTLKLDVNNCFGHYEILNSGKIDISAMGCTEICCDSDFAEDLSYLFPKMTTYYGKGEELVFEGEGKIILKQN